MDIILNIALSVVNDFSLTSISRFDTIRRVKMKRLYSLLFLRESVQGLPAAKIMSTKEVITKDGIVKEALMAGMFKVEMSDGEFVLASLSGKMRKFKIRILPGDKVKVEFSPHDLTRGRVSYRYR